MCKKKSKPAQSIEENPSKLMENEICALKQIGDNFDIRIVRGDVLFEDCDAMVLPLDPDLNFSNGGITQLYQQQIDSLEHQFEIDTQAMEERLIKSQAFRLPNARICYFCS